MKNISKILLKFSQKLDEKNLYAIADKLDRIANQNSLDFKTDKEALDYIKKIGIPVFSQAMDEAANRGVTVNKIPLENIPEMQKLYKESLQSSGGMAAMPAMPAMAPMAPIAPAALPAAPAPTAPPPM